MINKSLLTLGTVINKLAEGVQLNGGHQYLFQVILYTATAVHVITVVGIL